MEAGVIQINVRCAPHRAAATAVSGFISFHFAGPPERAAGFRARVLSVFDHLYTVDKNVFYAGRVLMRFFKGSMICNGGRIEDDHVRKHSLLKKSAMIKAKIRRW